MDIKNALSDDILLSVEKPARYVGNEVNIIRKDLKDIDIRFAMCFPDVYEIGMSHLGIQILYELFNRRNDTYCERVYSPWPDLHEIMKGKKIPLFTLETQSPVKDFDFLGITLQYEMCYTNVLQVLDLSDMPFLAEDRDETYPIVIGGGPCVYNAEPIADFFDIFYIGEGEVSYNALLDLYLRHKNDPNGYDKKAFLHEAAKIDGIYVPSLFDISYHPDGTISAITPLYDDIPKKVKRVVLTDMDEDVYPVHPLVPLIKPVQDRVVLEIQRGCIRGCRFCQAGMIYRPNREKSVDKLKEYAKEMLLSSGHEEISLSSLSTSDYSDLRELLDFLITECADKGISVSLPSLRIDAFSLDVMKRLSDVKKSSLTFAPEAGSQRMRNVINKGLTVEDIMGGAAEAFKGGWNKVKLYFMLGLPTETDEDILAIPELGNEMAALYYDTVPKEERHGKCQINMSTSFFVPKPFTPFQWAKMEPPSEYKRKARLLNDAMKEKLNHKSLSYQWHHPEVTILEGVFARGDRRVGKTILYAYLHGCLFDAWTDYFSFERWEEAFSATGVDMDFYTIRERSLDEILPWSHIDVGITEEFFKREWENAMKASVTPNCRDKCSGCGCRSYGGGVCYAG